MSEARSPYRRGRELRTRRSTRFADGSARALITVGGLTTIVAVLAVFVFLFWVVKDLFFEAEIGEPKRLAASEPGVGVLDAGIDEYRTIAWLLGADGVLTLRRADTGESLGVRRVVVDGGPRLTAFGKEATGGRYVLGYADGTVRLCSIGFLTEFLEVDAVGAELRKLAVDGIGVWGDGLAQRTVRGQFRVQTPQLVLDEPVNLIAGTPITAVARSTHDDATIVAAVGADGRVVLRVATMANALFDEAQAYEWGEPSPVSTRSSRGSPRFAQLTDLGSNLVLAWTDGTLERWAVRDVRTPRLAEVLDVAPEGGVELTSLGLLLGGVTLIAGRSDGVVGGWFVTANPSNEVDGYALREVHRFDGLERSPVVAIATSARERIFAVGNAAGRAYAMYMTSEKRLPEFTVGPQAGESSRDATIRRPEGPSQESGRGLPGRRASDDARPSVAASAAMGDQEPVLAIAIAPKSDAILTITARGASIRPFTPRHPEATFGSLFGATWYERMPQPTYTWQSSAGTDDFEPKLSLVPLIFGTVKATVYSMLLAVPLALFAAIYTAEFLHARTRARIKPIVELMASLPSVVLGFLAAIVIAPAAESIVPELVTAVITVPVAFLLGAHVWQALPTSIAVRRATWRLPLAAVALAAGIGAAAAIGPWVEDLLFAGDVRLWLDGRIPAVADGSPGWFLLLLPFSAVAVAWFAARRVTPRITSCTAGSTRTVAGLLHLAKFAGGLLATIAIAWVAAQIVYRTPTILDHPPFDLRFAAGDGGISLSPFGTFDQRNSLIVGFVMGFAVIPIIYTLAEDALTSVPEHLRAASLGCGATPWQTAVRVVVPTAMSGLFSACMVGLGRAVGETMIVLMAAGGTAVMNMNVFSGFRTLSANIATELPEAVRDSTHYRTLFLAALVLFAVTFVINSVAEAVRQRFRKRAYQL